MRFPNKLSLWQGLENFLLTILREANVREMFNLYCIYSYYKYIFIRICHCTDKHANFYTQSTSMTTTDCNKNTFHIFLQSVVWSIMRNVLRITNPPQGDTSLALMHCDLSTQRDWWNNLVHNKINCCASRGDCF